ncbi:hypothetical protein FCV62_03815 [Vibrio kanaloae]|uniref:hypothetical protein n=1 Tax=Vibrio kanaloae TaxID=170673 RepID=UPI0010BF18CF|nr:hypothetical protein [Vibrio kanaloae]TKF81180.1 hypothetical protein FCV62_03815 [Vibrio kanaloae]
MINIAECEIDPDRLSVSGIHAVQEILDTIETANLLSKVIAVIPFFDIFLKGKPHEKLTNVASYDWEEFGRVMRSVSDVNRKQIEKIAGEEWLNSSGKEHEFWKCVYQAM